MSLSRSRSGRVPPPAAIIRRLSRGSLPIVCVAGVAALSGCVDTLNASRADAPPALLRVADSLQAEHFSGAMYIDQPRPDALRLTVRDPGRCGDGPPALRDYATSASQRALALFRARPSGGGPATPIREVSVRFQRTHRFGALAWATSLGSFTFEADSLRSLSPPAPVTCGERLPSLLQSTRDSA